MILRLVGRVLAILWVAISMWIAGTNIFLLRLVLAGMANERDKGIMIPGEITIPLLLSNALFFLISGTAVYTWVFESPKNILRNVGHMLRLGVLSTLFFVVYARVLSRYRRS